MNYEYFVILRFIRRNAKSCLALDMNKLIALFSLMIIFSGGVAAQLPAYEFPAPAGWGKETFKLPPEFAKEITFEGIEDIRFTPGWSKQGNEQYWSYVFAWLIKGSPSLTGKSLSAYMTAYYNGIYLSNLGQKSAPGPGFTSAVFKKVNTSTGDRETFEGQVHTLNFLNHERLALHCRVHVRSIPARDASAILFEISPQPYSHSVWKELVSVSYGFRLK